MTKLKNQQVLIFEWLLMKKFEGPFKNIWRDKVISNWSRFVCIKQRSPKVLGRLYDLASFLLNCEQCFVCKLGCRCIHQVLIHPNWLVWKITRTKCWFLLATAIRTNATLDCRKWTKLIVSKARQPTALNKTQTTHILSPFGRHPSVYNQRVWAEEKSRLYPFIISPINCRHEDCETVATA